MMFSKGLWEYEVQIYLNGKLSSSFQLGFGPSATDVIFFSLWNITSKKGLTTNALQNSGKYI